MQWSIAGHRRSCNGALSGRRVVPMSVDSAALEHRRGRWSIAGAAMDRRRCCIGASPGPPRASPGPPRASLFAAMEHRREAGDARCYIGALLGPHGAALKRRRTGCHSGQQGRCCNAEGRRNRCKLGKVLLRVAGGGAVVLVGGGREALQCQKDHGS